jgi:16S rRNA U1498 N3-methylase RsmE
LLAERIQIEGRQRAEKRLDKWKEEAAEQAYRETRPEVMRLVDQIESLWAEAKAK